ncbi:MAG: AAA family ATPase, partial [Thermomicrobiales bacterium]
MNLVFLYGPPAAGKLTVARELAALTGFPVLHNHLTLDLVTSLFPFGSEPADRLVTEFRLAMLAEAARARLPGVISTFVYAYGADDDFIEQVLDAVEPHDGHVQFVLLRCVEAELLRRVTDPSRQVFAKMRDAAQLRALCQRE